jgi:TatD DNase family protein
MTLRWIDDHCHFDRSDDGSPSVDELLVAARAVGVERCITVGCDLVTSLEGIEVARSHEGVWATVGVHPHEAAGGLDGIEELLAAPEVVAVGECGFDLHYEHSPREAQAEVFATQIAMAKAHDLALVVHTRSAWPETFAMFDEVGMPERTVIHCFTGGPEEARRCLDLGAFLSFSGIITFKGAPEVREAAARCPLDRVLVETDAPWLAPVPHRGRPNEPAFVPLVAETVADVMGVQLGALAEATWANAARVYRLPI